MTSTVDAESFDRLLHELRESSDNILDQVFAEALLGRPWKDLSGLVSEMDLETLALVKTASETYGSLLSDLADVAHDLAAHDLSMSHRVLLASAVLAIPHGGVYGASTGYAKAVLRFLLEANGKRMPWSWWREGWRDSWFDAYRQLKRDNGSFMLFLGGPFLDSDSWYPRYVRGADRSPVKYSDNYLEFAKPSAGLRSVLTELWVRSDHASKRTSH